MENLQRKDCNREAFSLISNVCQDFMKNPGEDAVLKLRSLINVLPPETLQIYQRYIFMPLCVSLVKKSARENVKISVVECLSDCMNKTHVLEIDQFKRIFSQLFSLISDSTHQNIAPEVSEEFKLSVMKCVMALISNSSLGVISAFYIEKNIPLISHGIYFCLALLKEEAYLDLRLAALECLLHVCQVQDVQMRRFDKPIKVDHILMLCFPGITMGLKNVICADEKQNHKITMAAIRAWSRITAEVMGDCSTSENEEMESGNWISSRNDLFAFIDKKELPNDYLRDSVLKILRGKSRTKEWCINASRCIYPIVNEICLTSFTNWKVRLEMVQSAELLLTCYRNMQECVPSLVGLLLITSEDDVEEVSEKSKAALNAFSEHFGKSQSISLIEVMEDHFLKVTHKLSSSTPGEEQLKMSLNFICGYLRLLGRHAHHIIRSCTHLNAMLSGLINTVTLDYLVVSPAEDWSLGTNSADILKASVPWKCFKFFKGKSIFSKFKDICLLLGQHSDLTLLANYLLQCFHEDRQNRKEMTLIISEIFSCVSATDCGVLCSIIKRIIKSFLDPEMWQFGETEISALVPDISAAETRSRIVQACLLVEGLGMMSHVATSDQAKAASLDLWYFRICLYPILERIGQPNSVLAGAGKLALSHISQSMGVPIESVIHRNSDYVVRHVVLKLRHASGFSSPAPLHVLVAVLELCSPDIMNDLEEAVECVVNYGFKYLNSPRELNCLKCLFVFTKFVKTKFPNQKSPEDICYSDKNKSCSTSRNASAEMIGSVTQSLLDYKRLREVASCDPGMEKMDTKEQEDTDENCNSTTTNQDDCEDIEMKNETKTEIPKHIKLTVSVLKHILALVYSKDKERKLLAMDILCEGVQIIEGYDDELLPLVHKIWSPLSVQFTNEDPLVKQHAFNLLCGLAVAAKNFIRERTLRKILPEISKFLVNQSKISCKKDHGSPYRFSQGYKLQFSLLSGLGALAVNLDFQEQDLSEMLTAICPYLSHLQPQPLQDACIKTYKVACGIDPNIVFFKLSRLGNLYTVPPSEEFQIYHVPHQTHFSMEYHKNVTLLATYLRDGAAVEQPDLKI